MDNLLLLCAFSHLQYKKNKKIDNLQKKTIDTG